MAQILITWREIKEGDFPNCCITCGEHGAELVPRKLQTLHHRVFYRLRKWITVELPFCEEHQSRSWIAWGRMDAAEFTDEGVWLKNVAPEFIDALWEHREKAERKQRKARRFMEEHAGGRSDADRPSWKEDREEYEDEDEDRPRTRRPRRGDEDYERPNSWVAPLFIVLACLGLLFLFGALFFVNLVLPRGNTPGPFIGPRPGGAPAAPSDLSAHAGADCRSPGAFFPCRSSEKGDPAMLRFLTQPQITIEGGDLVIRSGIGGVLVYVVLGLIVFGLAAYFWLRKHRKDTAIAFAAFGVIVLAVVAPGAVSGSVRVSPTSIKQTTGMWFAPNVKEIDTSNTVRVMITSGRSGRWTVPVWNFVGRDGRIQSIDPGDLWISSTEEIKQELGKRGIQFDGVSQ